MPKHEGDAQSSKKSRATGSSKIKELEAELSKTKVNKRTESAVGQLKAKIARLKEEVEKKASSGKGGGHGYSVRKTGDGTVVLVGFPSVGKSTLLNNLTNANSQVGAYAFTTLTVVPGLLKHKQAKMQVLDVPGIVHGAAAGTGRGKEVLQVMRTADLVCFVIDVFHPEHFEALQKEVYDSGIRVNQIQPDVKIVKTTKGGIDIGATVRMTKLNNETIVSILKEFKIINAQIVFRDDIGPEQLIDVIQKNCVYIPAITIMNKIDMADEETKAKAIAMIKPDLAISAHEALNLEALKDLFFERLQLIRLYLKERMKKADMEEPMIMQQGQTLKDLCGKLHRDFIDKFKYARIWGPSAKFDGQMTRDINHKIADTDVIELTMR